MPKTLFDKVTPEYRSAVVPDNHWMSACHPYFIPNQPPPPPCGCCPPPPVVPPGGPCGCSTPLLDRAPAPCGFHEANQPKPVISPLDQVIPASPEAMPVRPAEAEKRSPLNYDGLRNAPHPYVYWLAKREVNVEAGENVSVDLAIDLATGDKTYTVSSQSPEEDQRRLNRLERQLFSQLDEIRRLKEKLNAEGDGADVQEDGPSEPGETPVDPADDTSP